MQDRYDFGVMAHITAMGYSRADLADLVSDYAKRGVRNFLALRGDPPRDVPDWAAPAEQPANAREVVEIIRKTAPPGVSVGVAGNPEKHPDAPSMEEDLAHLAEKVAAGADFVVTQLFFDNESYFGFVAAARRHGVKVPILPGIMPVTRAGQLERFRDLCHVKIGGVTPLFADEAAIKERSTGVSYAAAQCADLLRRGAPGIHLYTLNQSRASHTLYTILRSLGWEG
jgi:methylenetetrahydrofolate reductase (NADPH)